MKKKETCFFTTVIYPANCLADTIFSLGGGFDGKNCI